MSKAEQPEASQLTQILDLLPNYFFFSLAFCDKALDELFKNMSFEKHV